MLASSIDVEQIDKVFPTLIETLQVRGNLFAVGELFIVRINLVLHPAQVFDGFTLAGIKTLDEGLTLGLEKLAGPRFFAALNQTPIDRTSRNDREVDCLCAQREQERCHILKKCGANRKAGHAPKVNGFFECLLYVAEIDLRQFHETRLWKIESLSSRLVAWDSAKSGTPEFSTAAASSLPVPVRLAAHWSQRRREAIPSRACIAAACPATAYPSLPFQSPASGCLRKRSPTACAPRQQPPAGRSCHASRQRSERHHQSETRPWSGPAVPAAWPASID